MAFEMFEKTMKACVESRDARSAKKNLAETKKRPAKKAVTEKISRLKKESEEDDVDDIPEDDEDLEMDFADGIIAVRDPELDDDAMTAVAKGFQDIIDATEDGEIPETTEYIGKSIYGCPVCGETFFSEMSLEDGGVCPMCGEEAQSFVLAGDVEASEDDIVSDEEDFGDFDFDGEELEDVEGDDEDVDIDIEIKGDPEKKSDDEDEDEKNESLKKEGKKCTGKDCKDGECDDVEDEDCGSKKSKDETRRPIRRTSRVERPISRRTSRLARERKSLKKESPCASGVKWACIAGLLDAEKRGDEEDIDKFRNSLRNYTDDEVEEMKHQYKSTSPRYASNERRLARRSENRIAKRPTTKVAPRRPIVHTESKSKMNLDEKTFNTFLNKFAFENYKNVKSFEVVGANKRGNKLSLECKVSYKNGKEADTTLTGIYTKESRVMRCKDDGILKAESSKVAPISFRISTRGNVIRCEGMSYDFNTKAKIENKMTAVNVKGSYLNESTSKSNSPAIRRASRKVAESRRRAVRPASRRVTESRNRRTSIRRRSIR